jgi:hypothetical protein
LLSFPAGASWVLASWGAYLPLIILSCSIVILLVFFVYFRLWIDENKSVRFWLYASLLSLIPVCSTMAQDRLAILQTVGMDIVIAGLLYYAFFQASQLSLYRRYFAILLVVCHLLLSPLHLVLGSAYLHWAAAHIEKNALSIRGEMEGKLMVVMQAPIGEVVTFAGLRQVHGKDIPKQILWLSNDEGRLQVQIESGRSLLVEKKPGFATGFESAFRSAKAESLDIGKRIQVGDVSIYPLRKNMQGYVDKIRVVFAQEVSSGHILFYRLDNDGYHPLTLAELALVYAAN